MTITLDDLRRAADEIQQKRDPVWRENARAEFWRLYAKWMEYLYERKNKLFGYNQGYALALENELLKARAIAAEVESRT